MKSNKYLHTTDASLLNFSDKFIKQSLQEKLKKILQNRTLTFFSSDDEQMEQMAKLGLKAKC